MLSGMVLSPAFAASDSVLFETDTPGDKGTTFTPTDSARVTFGADVGGSLAIEDLGANTQQQGLVVSGPNGVEMVFTVLIDYLTFYFGNDDPLNTSEGDLARVTLFNGLTQVGQIDQPLNRNNAADQFMNVFGVGTFDRAYFHYVSPVGTPLPVAETVDSMFFEEPFVFNDEIVLTTIWTGAKEGGDAVPGAGVDPRIVADSTFTKFGTPSENDNGERAFVASWAGPTGKGTGIFAGDPEELIVAKGDLAPGTTAAFSTLRDPLFNNNGRIAFLGKIKGDGVTSANDSGIWSNVFDPSAALAEHVREGAEPPDVPGAAFKSFNSVAIGDHGLAFTALMVPGTGGVTKENDLGLWIDGGAGLTLVAREGQTLPEGVVKKLTALTPGPLTRGHGNGVGSRGGLALLGVDEEFGGIEIPVDEPVVAVAAQFVDGTQALYQATPAGLTLVVKSGDAAGGYGPGVAFTKVAKPGSGRSGAFAFLAKAKGPGVSGPSASSVNAWDNDSILSLAKGGDALDSVSGATFKSFKSPASNSWGTTVVGAKIAGSGIDKNNDQGLWMLYPYGGDQLIAREGDIAPGTAIVEGGEHAEFSKFKGVALPEQGSPVFLAKLRTGPGGTDKTNDDGAWATGFYGFPQLIIREGQTYDGKIVKKFTLLSSVRGSQMQARSHNANSHLLMRVDFTDRSQAIVDVALPTGMTPH